ncbi:hypothetical protein [Cryobacterium sp. N22]|uniref:acyltransferase n=1 Tax=Cryobacterium sp. N22 TaxID=2048290 RepID=UPI000CE3E294|nr:hypothetical protein [Cryobacterium sp. N22]
MKRLITLVVGFLPASTLKNMFLRWLGHEVARSASIAPVVLLGNKRLIVGDGARIGPFNVFRSLEVVSLGAWSEIGQFNWISAAPFLVHASSSTIAGSFSLGVHSSLTSRHYLDASGGIAIEEFVTVAGVRSVFMSHGIDVADNVLDSLPIRVERYAMLGGSCSLVMGATVPAHSVVAMGSVVTRGLDTPYALYAGVPARFKKLVPAGDYSTRTHGAVPARPKNLLSALPRKTQQTRRVAESE